LFSPLSHGLDSERGRKTAEEHEKFDLANREKKPNRHVRFDTYFGNTYSPLYSSGCTWDPVLVEGRHRQRRVKGGVWSFWGETVRGAFGQRTENVFRAGLVRTQEQRKTSGRRVTWYSSTSDAVATRNNTILILVPH
jgi:hypothetical protein